MKKIGLIAGLATMVTVGGVFAAWQFGGLTNLPSTQEGVSVSVEETIENVGVTLGIESSVKLHFSQDAERKGYTTTVGAEAENIKLVYSENESNIPINLTATWSLIVLEDKADELQTYMNHPAINIGTTKDIQIPVQESGEIEILTVETIANAMAAVDRNNIQSAAAAGAFKQLIVTENLFKISVTITEKSA